MHGWAIRVFCWVQDPGIGIRVFGSAEPLRFRLSLGFGGGAGFNLVRGEGFRDWLLGSVPWS